MSNFDELWPFPVRGLVHVTGPRGVGKTVFCIATGADPKRIAFFDGEQSASTYNHQLGFGVYRDLVAEFTAKHSAFGSDLEYYKYTNREIEKLPDGAFDVFIFDNISRFENGMAEYVSENPKEFGLTHGQIEKMAGLKWGKIKSLYEKWLINISNKAKLICVTTQLGEDYRGGRPTGAKKPKGKETLEWLSILQLWLRPNVGSSIPSAVVLKERLGRWDYVHGVWMPRRCLPRRLPECTWDAIRHYLNEPADLENPKPSEVLSEEEWHMLRGTLTDEQRMQLRLAVLDAEAETTKTVKRQPEEGNGIANVGEFLAKLFARGFDVPIIMAKLGIDDLSKVQEAVMQKLGLRELSEIEDLETALAELGFA